MRQSTSLLAAVIALAPAAAGQQVILAVRTATVTQCVTAIGGTVPTCAACAPTPIVQLPAVTGRPIRVQIEAPECRRCGCATCTHIIKFTTEYDAFCSTGLTRQAYECTETYKGMSAMPTLPSADLPLGFTKDVQTCYTCGLAPITATITRPITEPQGTPINALTGGSGPDSGSGFGLTSGSGPGHVPGSGYSCISPPCAGSYGGSNAPTNISPSTVKTAASPSIMPLAVSQVAILFSACAMTAFIL